MSELALLHVPRQLVIFRVGETHYGFDIEAVNEILPVLAITPAPGTPPGVLGLADVRKRVVPVFDLHWKFGVTGSGSSNDARLILVQGDEGPVAMLVDSVEEVLTVSRDEFQQVSTPGDTAGLGYLSGVLRRNDKLMLWVDHNGLVPRGVSAAIAA